MSPPKLDHVYRTIALIGKFQSRDTAEALAELAQALCARGITVLVEEKTATYTQNRLDDVEWQPASFEEIGKKAQLVIVLGGDGSFLAAARNLSAFQVPLVGVNQGRLGFMTDIARSDMISCLDSLLSGRFTPSHRMVLSAEAWHEDQPCAQTPFLAVNDVVVDKGGIGRMIELELFIDHEFVYNLRADGLIVATPSGSTAYALSAGGPILQPILEGVAIVPLNPHALTNRPLIVPANSKIDIRIVHGEDTRMHCDGQLAVDVRPGDSVRIERAPDRFCLLHPPGYSYYSMLRQKLQWSERPKP